MPQKVKQSRKKQPANINFVFDVESNTLNYLDKQFNFSSKKAETLTADDLASWVHEDDLDELQSKFKNFIAGTLSGSAEFRIKVDSSDRWLRVIPFYNESKDKIWGNIVEITAEINNSQAIRRYANKKNSILNMLAHDLKGPLSVANNIAKSLDKQIADSHSVKQINFVSVILSESISLIEDLINRELIDTLEVELSLSRIDLVIKLEEYLEECKRSEAATNRVFNFTRSKKNIYIHLDEAKFMQIMNNLMTNSLKFTHPGGIINVDLVDQKKSVLIKFGDNGIGIPEHLQGDIFEKFTKARRKGLNGEPTIGLGLSIVKTIVEWHKGKIWFESKGDGGTTFFMEIPK